eukprot:c40013_g1_i1 orf=3-161(-)
MLNVLETSMSILATARHLFHVWFFLTSCFSGCCKSSLAYLTSYGTYLMLVVWT